MATSKKDRSARLIVLAERAILAGGSGAVMDDPRFAQLAFSGISARVDGEIRKRVVTEGPWAELTAERVRGVALERPGLAVLFACHPDGFVRQAALERACQWLQSPGAAQIIALRTIDPVPAIREMARAAIGTLLSDPDGAWDAGVPPSNVVAAARQIVGTAKCLDTCPEIVTAALDLVPARYTNGFPSRSDREVHRREQTLRHLQERPVPDDPAQVEATRRMIEWYRQSLEAEPLAEGDGAGEWPTRAAVDEPG